MRFAPSWRIGGSVGPRLLHFSYTLFRSGRRYRRHPYYYGRLPDGWHCPHHHTRPDTANECAERELRRRARAIRP